MAAVTDTVAIAYSGGKDSAVTLDICARHFKNISVFFMYQVPGLSFQESTLKWAENKYGIEIMRIPHFEISDFIRGGVFRSHQDAEMPKVKINDVYSYVRQTTGAWWIAAGERINDSLVRRAMIKKSGTIDQKRGRFYPIAEFSKDDVQRYIVHHQIKISPESAVLGHSFRSLVPNDMLAIKKHYPDDFRKVCSFFPFAEAAALKAELKNES